MLALRMLLVAMVLGMYSYTGYVALQNGWGILPAFLEDVSAMNWSGQFNLDFSCYLLLSALWIAWRNRFSFSGIALGALSSVLGISFLAPYLLYLTFKTQGNLSQILLGAQKSS
jgi:hypothetical protein